MKCNSINYKTCPQDILDMCITGVQYVYIIDQAQGQDGWILAEISFCEVHKDEKRERGRYPAILPK